MVLTAEELHAAYVETDPAYEWNGLEKRVKTWQDLLWQKKLAYIQTIQVIHIRYCGAPPDAILYALVNSETDEVTIAHDLEMLTHLLQDIPTVPLTIFCLVAGKEVGKIGFTRWEDGKVRIEYVQVMAPHRGRVQ